ncbi:MAG: hypothetical protein ACE5K0_09115 [Candidatus Methanofastidiosia archaeon]
MKIKTPEEIFFEIGKEYNRSPQGWRVAASREGGRYNLFISKGKKLWQIKTEFITPYKTLGVGGQVRARVRFSENPHTFGWRPLTKKQIKAILKEVREKNRISERLFKELMRIEPKPLTNLNESGVLQGPLEFTSSLSEISESQRKLDSELSKELDKLVFRRRGLVYL